MICATRPGPVQTSLLVLLISMGMQWTESRELVAWAMKSITEAARQFPHPLPSHNSLLLVCHKGVEIIIKQEYNSLRADSVHVTRYRLLVAGFSSRRWLVTNIFKSAIVCWWLCRFSYSSSSLLLLHRTAGFQSPGPYSTVCTVPTVPLIGKSSEQLQVVCADSITPLQTVSVFQNSCTYITCILPVTSLN
jgi:hypothetical protein